MTDREPEKIEVGSSLADGDLVPPVANNMHDANGRKHR